MTTRLPTLQEIRTAHWREPVRAAYERHLLMNTYLFRPVSFVLTWAAMRVGLSSEAVSWLSGAVGLAAYALLLSRSPVAIPAGLALLCLFNLLDCVDGDLARTQGTRNPYGRFLDSVCGGIIDLSFWAVVGAMAFRHPDLLHWPEAFGLGPLLWAAAGALTCFAALTIELIERTFDQLVRPHWEAAGLSPAPEVAPTVERRGPRAVLRDVLTNVRVRETHYVLLIVACALSAVDVLLMTYLAYYTVHILGALGIYRGRGLALKRVHD